MTGALQRLVERVSLPVIGVFLLTTYAVAVLVNTDVEIANVAAALSAGLVAIIVLAVATGIEFRDEHPYPFAAVLWRLSPLVLAAGLALFVVVALPDNAPKLPPPLRRSGGGGGQQTTPPPSAPQQKSDLDPGEILQYTVMVLVSLAIVAAVGWAVWRRLKLRRARAAALQPGARGQAVEGSDLDEHELEQARAVREALERSRSALLTEDDPRLAVIRAYLAFESHVGAQGMMRKPAETQREYIARVLAQGQLAAPDRAPQLVELFNTARFSTQPVTAADAMAAQNHIDALVGD